MQATQPVLRGQLWQRDLSFFWLSTHAYNQGVWFIIVATAHNDLCLRTFNMPFASPMGFGTRAGPVSAVVDYCTTLKGNHCRRRRCLSIIAPGRVPRLTEHSGSFLSKNVAHQIEVMDRHVRQ